MQTISLADAKNNLSRLVDEASDGRDIVISKHGRPLARLVSVGKPHGVRFGLMKGQIKVSDDFDDELTDDVLAGFEGRS